MAIQIQQQKKKNPILLILLIVVVIIFVGFKIIQKLNTTKIINISQSGTKELADIKNTENIDNIMLDINKVLQDEVFQQLVSHSSLDVIIDIIGKEDPFSR